MVDVVEALYDPLFAYHKAKGDGTTRDDMLARGNAIADSAKLGGQIALKYQNINTLLQKVAESPNAKSSKTLNTAIIERWKEDEVAKEKADREGKKTGPTTLDQLNADLANPATAKRLQEEIVKDPDRIAKILPQYKGGNLDALLAPAAAPAAKVEQKIERKAEATEPAKKVEAKVEQKKGPQHVDRKEPSPAKRGPSERVEPVAAVAGAGASAAAITPKQDTPETIAVRNEINKKIFEGFADQPNEKIATAINEGMTRSIADGIADQSAKLGVSQELVDGFKKRIDTDPKLRAEITKKFQENPEFIRQLAKMSKDGGEIPDGMKELAKKQMTDVMENPEKLANDGFLKRMTSGMQMKNGFSDFNNSSAGNFLKGMGIDLGGIMGSLGGMFQQLIDWIGGMVKQFSGGEVLSMKNSGRTMGQTFGIISDNASSFKQDERQAMQTMQVHPLMVNGQPKYRHEEPVREPDGSIRQGTSKLVQNTIEIETINGTKHKVLPATGSEAIRDAQGNYHVWMVTDADDGGKPKSGFPAVMREDQLNAYNANLKQYGQPGNAPKVTMIDPANSQSFTYVNPGSGQVMPAGQATQPAVNDPTYDRAEKERLDRLDRERKMAANEPSFSQQA